MSSEDTLNLLRGKIDEIMAEKPLERRDSYLEPAHSSARSFEPLLEDDDFEAKLSTASSYVRPGKKKARNRTSDSGEFEDTPQKAFSKITAILNVADKSEHALRARLLKAGFGQESVDEAVERAKSYGFIDDLRFADLLIRSRLSQGKGSAGIERELKEHRIDPETVPGWPYEYGIEQDAEVERAIDFLRKKPPKSKNPRDGAYRKLMQKGFPSSVSSSAARIWAESDWA